MNESLSHEQTGSYDWDNVLTFDSQNRTGMKILSLLGSGLVFTCSIVFMLIWLFTKPRGDADSIIPGLIGGFCVVPIFSFIGAFLLMRNARRVTMDAETLIIDKYGWSSMIPYESIARIDRQIGGGSPYAPMDTLILLDEKNKVLGRIPMKMSNFELLDSELQRRVQRVTGQVIYDRERELAEKRLKRKRERRFIAATLGFFMLLGITTTIWGYIDYSRETLLTKNGITAEASVKRHYLFNNRGHKLEYVLTVDDKEYVRDVLVKVREWNALENATTVPVRYLPGKPETSRLEQGEDNGPGGLPMLLIGIVCTGFISIMFIIFVLLGYDLVSHEGTMYLLKRGQIIEDRLDELRNL